MSTKTFSLMKSASVLALGVAIAVAGVTSPMPGFQGYAWADEPSDGDGGSGGQQGNQGGQGQGGIGSQQGQGNQGQGEGQGGPGEDSDGQGPQAGGPSDSAGGGMPPWASEGIPEVELGRLSVARSPDHLERERHVLVLGVVDLDQARPDLIEDGGAGAHGTREAAAHDLEGRAR